MQIRYTARYGENVEIILSGDKSFVCDEVISRNNKIGDVDGSGDRSKRHAIAYR